MLPPVEVPPPVLVLVGTPPPVLPLPTVVVTIPPAGGPAVDVGEVLVMHELLGPAETTNWTLPPVPKPRWSPATSRTVVPARRAGVQLKPTPALPGALVSVPTGTENDSPPGMTP